jgi:hypothetical protein
VELQGLRRAKPLGGDEGGRFWCLRKCEAGYTSPCGFGSPYVSRRCEKWSFLGGNAGILC